MFEVDSGGPVDAGIDGEAVQLPPPLRFAIRPGALRIRLPGMPVDCLPPHATSSGGGACVRRPRRRSRGSGPGTTLRPPAVRRASGARE